MNVKCYRCGAEYAAGKCACRDGITLVHGDCREVLPQLESGSVDLVLTDPPYGIAGGRGGDRRFGKGKYVAEQWDDTPEYIEGVVAPVISTLKQSVKRMAITPGLRCWRMYPSEDGVGCFWLPAAVTHGPWGFTCFTPIFFYGYDPRSGVGQLPSGISVTESSEKNGHPCPKPIAAWKWLLNKLAPEENEVTLDPFCGSGTTLRAAKDLGRRAIGIEIEERYVAIAAKRLQQECLPFTD